MDAISIVVFSLMILACAVLLLILRAFGGRSVYRDNLGHRPDFEDLNSPQ